MNDYSTQQVQNKTLRVTKKVLNVFVTILNIIMKLFLSIVLVFCIAGTIVASGVAYYVFNMVDSSSGIELEHLSLNETSIIYANDTQTQQPVEVTRLHGSENRIWVDLDQIPQYMVDAAVAIEDKRFWDHQGVDWKRTAGAFANSLVNIYGSNAGGSTITQQLIKNLTGEDEVTIDRKVKEIMRALDLEKHYSKDQIIEAYLNTIHLGAGCNGVQAAANKYFDKDAKDLNLAECASIIGITQYPTKYNPLIHPDNNKARQEVILNEMLEQGKITQQEHDEAVAYQLVFKEQTSVDDPSNIESYYTDTVIRDVKQDLQDELGYDEEYAEWMLYSGGLRIYMAVDNNIQSALESYYIDPDNFPQKRGVIQAQSSMTVLGYDGRILGLVGGVGEKEYNLSFNRATQARRQVGSSMKPIGAYAPAINENVITWSTMVPNQPITVDGKKWPPNFGGGGYGQPVTVQYGLMRSLNTVAVRVVEQLGLETSFEYATERFGLDLVRYEVINAGTDKESTVSDIGYSPLALGGFTYGVSSTDMAAAFQVFGNGGYYNEPWSYYKVTDAKGNVILEHVADPQQVIDSDSAWVMNQLLRTVVSSRGTGANARFGDWTIFAKTGTSGSSETTYDVTFCGGTPYYVAASWFGFDNPRHLSGSFTSGAQNAWKNVMKQIHQDLPDKSFEKDDSVVTAKYCSITGDLAGPGCPSGGTGYYRSGNIPPVCDGSHGGSSTNTTTTSQPSNNTPSSTTPSSNTGPNPVPITPPSSQTAPESSSQTGDINTADTQVPTHVPGQ